MSALTNGFDTPEERYQKLRKVNGRWAGGASLEPLRCSRRERTPCRRPPRQLDSSRPPPPPLPSEEVLLAAFPLKSRVWAAASKMALNPSTPIFWKLLDFVRL